MTVAQGFAVFGPAPADGEHCGVLIGTPRWYRACGLPGDPCSSHEKVAGVPRTAAELAARWAGIRMRRRAPTVVPA